MELPHEVVLHILASLPLRDRLQAAQASQWLHDAAMQPSFWPTQPHGTPQTSPSHRSRRNSTAAAVGQLPQDAAATSRVIDTRTEASPDHPADVPGPGPKTPAGGSPTFNDHSSHVHTNHVLPLHPGILGPAGRHSSSGHPHSLLDTSPAACHVQQSVSMANQCDGLQQQQQQAQSGLFPDANGWDAEDKACNSKQGQDSLLGFACEQRGPTILVAVVDPVTGQKGYARQAKAQGLESRWAVFAAAFTKLHLQSSVTWCRHENCG